MSKIPEKHQPKFKDDFFVQLDKILLPVGGKKFEKMAMDVAFYIAHEYGAKLDILHIGKEPGNTINEFLEKCDLGVDDIAMFIPHQMNARIIESVGKRLKFTDDRIFINIDKYGNTSAASIPIALDECRQMGY